ncbi:hypothetical protein SMICM304S_08544 [Streptomyces microflavus]
MCAKLTIWTPTTITRAASAASGIHSNTVISRPAARRTQTPCSTVEARPVAPARTLAEPRTTPPATGSPPSSPVRVLAMPWPRNSRSRSDRRGGAGEVRGACSPARSAASLSTATAASSDSRLATSSTVNTAVARARTGP